jgi:hypothetical protein
MSSSITKRFTSSFTDCSALQVATETTPVSPRMILSLPPAIRYASLTIILMIYRDVVAPDEAQYHSLRGPDIVPVVRVLETADEGPMPLGMRESPADSRELRAYPETVLSVILTEELAMERALVVCFREELVRDITMWVCVVVGSPGPGFHVSRGGSWWARLLLYFNLCRRGSYKGSRKVPNVHIQAPHRLSPRSCHRLIVGSPEYAEYTKYSGRIPNTTR